VAVCPLAAGRISGHVSGNICDAPVPSKSEPQPRSALAEYRRRLRGRGLQRVEVQVHGEDAPLVRAVAAALADPGRAAEARALLRGRFAPAPARSLKDLLASIPLEGVELDRPRDAGRAVERLCHENGEPTREDL
jgi:hypothetical protein